MFIFKDLQSINDVFQGIKYIFPRNWMFIILILIIISIIIFLYKDIFVNKISNFKKYLIFHRNKLKNGLIIAICAILILAFAYNLNLFSSKPQEDTFLVAIAPFYSELSGKPMSDNYDIPNELKTKIESYNNLGIDVIILDHSKDVEFQGKNKGAHLVVYGKRIEDVEGNVEIEYNILALTNLDAIPSEMQFNVGQTNETNGLMFSESATYYKYLDRPITVREPLNENASSTVFLISAFEKYKKSNFTSALTLFKSIKNYDNSPSILFYIANSYYFNNDLNKSLQYLDKIISINSQYAEVWHNRGVILVELGRYEEALAAYDKATQINPQFAEAWNNKGGILDNLGMYEEALTAYDKATQINSQFAIAWNNKRVILFKLGRYEDVLVASDKATQINPQDAAAWNNKGVILFKLERYEEALNASDKATQINPQYAEGWNNKGSSLFKLGMYEEALVAYDKATQINPQFAGAWFNKGNILDNLGMYEEALTAYDKATQINPQYTGAWNNKGFILSKLGMYEEALNASDKATQINPQDAGAWFNKGYILSKLGRYEGARIAFETAYKLDSKFVVPSLPVNSTHKS